MGNQESDHISLDGVFILYLILFLVLPILFSAMKAYNSSSNTTNTVTNTTNSSFRTYSAVIDQSLVPSVQLQKPLISDDDDDW